MPHDHIVAVRQTVRPLARDLLPDSRRQESIEPRTQVGFVLDLADGGAVFPRLRKPRATRDCLGVMFRDCRLEPRPPSPERRIAILSQRGTGQNQREKRDFNSGPTLFHQAAMLARALCYNFGGGAFAMRTRRIGFGLAICLTVGLSADPAAISYQRSIAEWRAQRETKLKAEDGWLTVVGLTWLKEGANRVGSNPSFEVRLPKSVPASVGTLTLKAGK